MKKLEDGKNAGKLAEHLGDGVYAIFDDFGIWLHANDHENPTDRVYLEPSVLTALNRFDKQARAITAFQNMKRGTQIIYLPDHAKDEDHPDAEPGFIFNKTQNPEVFFCRYWNKHRQWELRTKANSEATNIRNIFVKDTKPQKVVDKMIEKIDEERKRGL